MIEKDAIAHSAPMGLEHRTREEIPVLAVALGVIDNLAAKYLVIRLAAPFYRMDISSEWHCQETSLHFLLTIRTLHTIPLDIH